VHLWYRERLSGGRGAVAHSLYVVWVGVLMVEGGGGGGAPPRCTPEHPVAPVHPPLLYVCTMAPAVFAK